jgi:TonB family protein
MAAASAFTVVAFTVTDSATVDDAVLVASSQSPDFDHNVIRAMRAAGKAGLPRVPKSAGKSVRFELAAEAMAVADTMLPVWSSATPAVVHPGTQVATYPNVSRRQSERTRDTRVGLSQARHLSTVCRVGRDLALEDTLRSGHDWGLPRAGGCHLAL